MRRPTLAAVVALLATTAATPSSAAAQPIRPGTPVAFTGPTRTYAVSGCGDGPLSVALGAPSVRLFCLAGTATVGVATNASGAAYFQTVLDLTGTRLNGFTGQFFDIDYSNIQFTTTNRQANGQSYASYQAFGPALDPTGHTTSGYALPVPLVGTTQPYEVLPDGITFGPQAAVQLGYVPSDAPGSAFDYGRPLSFNLAVTATAVPEPATLALTLGGLAVLGTGAWRRRRA